MNYLISTRNFPVLTNLALLFARVFIGIAMIILHVLPKVKILFDGGSIQFYNFVGLGSKNTLILAIILELVFSFFLIIGLFSRVASIILSLVMLTAAFIVNSSQSFSAKELSLVYLTIYILITACGPGRYSVDQMMNKKGNSRY